MEFMSNLPIRKVPGIGRVSERWLRGLGVNTVGDIFKKRGKLYLVVRLISFLSFRSELYYTCLKPD